ncbi:hypothetical protein ACM66B_005914 [Microbotryomycetes sp. NB124-2]
MTMNKINRMLNDALEQEELIACTTEAPRHVSLSQTPAHNADFLDLLEFEPPQDSLCHRTGHDHPISSQASAQFADDLSITPINVDLDLDMIDLLSSEDELELELLALDDGATQQRMPNSDDLGSRRSGGQKSSSDQQSGDNGTQDSILCSEGSDSSGTRTSAHHKTTPALLLDDLQLPPSSISLSGLPCHSSGRKKRRVERPKQFHEAADESMIAQALSLGSQAFPTSHSSFKSQHRRLAALNASSGPRLPSPPPKQTHQAAAAQDVQNTALSQSMTQVQPGAIHRRSQPTQAEMDAFFGFRTLPPPELLPPLPLPVVTDAGDSESSSGSSQELQEVEPDLASGPSQPDVEDGDYDPSTVHERDRPSCISDRYEFKPVSESPTEADTSSVSEKHVAIVAALEDVTVYILSRLLQILTISSAIEQNASDAEGVLAMQQRQKQICVALPKRQGSDNRRKTLKREIRFPSPTGSGQEKHFGAKKLARLLRVIDIVHEGLENDQVITKRDLYYRDVKCFGKQQVVDTLVDDLAAALSVRRTDLNVIAASKGLFAGGLTIKMKHGGSLEGGKKESLIPAGRFVQSLEINPTVKWVLVVEKEAIFRSLCDSELLNDNHTISGIIFTGKGYPDVATRELLSRLSSEAPDLPIFGLFDADPHGIDILSTYQHGSRAMSFDNEALQVASIQWIGLQLSQLDAYGVQKNELLPLTLADRRKALSLLKRVELVEFCKRELERMLHLQYKAEIEVLCSKSVANSQQSNAPRASDSQDDNKLVRFVHEQICGSFA